jgi:hypothetical protein
MARQSDSLTENGAITNSTTLNSVLDLFFVSGSARQLSDTQVLEMIEKSYAEDRLLTLKLLFWSGDIRGGAGERRFFKLGLDWLYGNHKRDFYMNLEQVPEFSRWDSLFNYTEDSVVMTFIYGNYIKGNNLLSKWLPRKKQYNNFASKFRKRFGISPKEYRKNIVKNTSVVETNMCSKSFNTINYEHVPSVAMSRYKQAFYKNDADRFSKYIEDVTNGTKKINAGAVFPNDVIKSMFNFSGWFIKDVSEDMQKSIVAQWKNLPNYLSGSKETILPVCDVSGSMYDANAIHIAMAMTLYLSERNESIFKDAFITFSAEPTMHYLSGTVVDRLKQISQAGMGYNTDFVATMKLVLDVAKENRLSQEELPSKLLVLSDMEFDDASNCYSSDRKTIHQTIKKMFDDAGYVAPQIVYWNIQARSTSNFPVNYTENGTGLVSGQSPSIIKSILSNEISPMSIMLKTLDSDRYRDIKIGE